MTRRLGAILLIAILLGGPLVRVSEVAAARTVRLEAPAARAGQLVRLCALARQRGVAVLSADGSRLLYATYLGGSGGDLIRSVALDGKGGVYLAGYTESADFPYIGDNAAQKEFNGVSDGIIIKLEIE